MLPAPNSLSSNSNYKDSDAITFEANPASNTVKSPNASRYSISHSHSFVHDLGSKELDTISIEDTGMHNDNNGRNTCFCNSSSLLDLHVSQVLDTTDTTSRRFSSIDHQHFIYNPGGYPCMDKHNNFTTAITAQGIDPIRSLDLMQVTCPAFNDMTSPSADDHPFLLADSQHANTTLQ